MQSGYSEGVELWERNGWKREPVVWNKLDRYGKMRLVAGGADWAPVNRFSVSKLSQRDEPMLTTFTANWADWDQSGRLVVVQEGKLMSVSFHRRREPEWIELEDFTDDKFEAVAPPADEAHFSRRVRKRVGT